MHKGACIFLLFFLARIALFAQVTIVKGSVLDGTTGEPIPDALITIEENSLSTKTDNNGEFVLQNNIPLGDQYLRVEKVGYITKRYPLVINEGKTVNISGMTLDYDGSAQRNMFVISLSEDQLNSEDDGLTDNISGLLQSSRDVFLNAAAYDFSATFFRPRGLDNANGKVLINGIEMNKQFNGRPQWANWGGLNDVQRNQEFTMGMSANEYTFGDLAGTNNIIMRASSYRKGGRLSVASANRSYRGRLMGSYSSGLLNGGWSYSVLASRRFGDEGFVDGTLYDSNSFTASVEKQLNNDHAVNLTAIYAQNRRGRSTAITDEVFNLKGRDYNPLWGILQGKIRNSRTREIEEPIIMFNHYWDISSKTTLNTNVAYQFGKIGNTRIDNGGTRLISFNGQESYIGGARNPDPSYYQNLPTYFLRNGNGNPSSFDYEQSYLAEQAIKENGQLDWAALYFANTRQAEQGFNSIYIIQEDRNDDKQFILNSILDTDLADNIRLNATFNFRKLTSDNYARVEDLLGGTGFLDVDFFAEESGNIDDRLENLAQSDVRNRNRIVIEGDRYKYNYIIDARVINGFIQAQFKYSKIDLYIGANLTQTIYQRNGLYENGNFLGELSFGKSEELNFSDLGVKAGTTYRITGRHLLDFNGSYFTKAPNLRNSFSNVRQNNNVVTDLKSEEIRAIDGSYIYRSPLVKARLTGFYTKFNQGTDIAFYFTEDLGGLGLDNGNAFVQEVLTGIAKRNIGLELGIEAQVTSTIKLKAAASTGQFTYDNNPNLYLTSDDFNGELRFGDGTTKLKNLHVAGGPERAYQLGFEYRDQDYWWFGATSNYFSNAYIDVSNLARSANFTTDFDGQPFNNYDPTTAALLLKQEEFDDYVLVNVIGGKSWLVKDYFIGFFATISNVFNQQYRTGGFEQSRLANYRILNEDKNRKSGAVFGPRYYNGYGATYYFNIYVRF